jgi:TM2 domain-containing membrane protein YozV/predicted RNA-binding Zn-ribbon protein involved in translation (DUF1610 family)
LSDSPIENVGIPRGPDQKYCFSCAKSMHVSATNCPACGARQPDITELTSVSGALVATPGLGRIQTLQANQVFCRSCGQPISQLAPHCPNCGAPHTAMSQASPYRGTKNKVIAAIFAFFLGGLGVHKFYLGEVGLGIIYLLFCWTFIPAIIGFIEGIVYLATSDENFAKRYG